ncbi:hypothetical protein Tco_0673528 [Tanacetum coccineum]
MEPNLYSHRLISWEVSVNSDAPHLLKFSEFKDYKDLWEAIKTGPIKLKLKLSECGFLYLYENTSSTKLKQFNTAHEVSTASSQGQASSSTYVNDVMFSFFANQSNSPQLDNEDLEQI